MNIVLVVIVWWLVPAGIAWKIGISRNRRGWLWGLLSWVGVLAVASLPDLSRPERES